MLSRINSLRICAKLSLVYGIMMAVLLFATTAFTAIGLYYTQYHQVEGELSFSIRYVLGQLSRIYGPIEENVSGTLPLPPHPVNNPEDMVRQKNRLIHDDINGNGGLEELKSGNGHMRPETRTMNMRRGAKELELMPGVFMKITDSDGNVVYDSDGDSPALVMLTSHIEKNPPIWANPNFQVIESDNFIIYYKNVPVKIRGTDYGLHFFKTITAENRLLALIRKLLLAEILAGIFIALLLGYFVSRRLLEPVRQITDTAKSIQVSDLGRRIPVSPARDELSELAETFNTMLDRIQKGFHQQQQFVSDASHELRTPVTVIKGYSDMLSRWGSQDEKILKEGLEAIGSEAEDMQELIEKLLFLARADQKRQIIRKEPLAMQELVEDIYKKLELTDKDHSHKLLANDAAVVLADKVTMRHMLRIFLENAIKYTPAGGNIELGSQLIDKPGIYKVLQVTIADTGIGIPKEDQEKIFDRFYRVDSSRTKKAGTPGGTGLGLSIARSIAREHGIRIRLHSSLGEGTSFMLDIPVMEN